MKGLVDYGDSDSDEDISHNIRETIKINAAPDVVVSRSDDYTASNKALALNLPMDLMSKPQLGADNPFTRPMDNVKNSYTGIVEPVVMEPLMFEDQRHTFRALGYAVDPATSDQYVGNVGKAQESQGRTLLTTKTKTGSRKRAPRGDPGDTENFSGPWAGFADDAQTTLEQEESKHKQLTEKEIEKIKKQRAENLHALPVRKKRG
jgi:hypothetical protein